MMELYYTKEVLEAALTQNGADSVTDNIEDTARFCLAISNLERCFGEKVKKGSRNEIVALDLFRLI